MDIRRMFTYDHNSVSSGESSNYMTILALEDGLQAKLSGNTISYSLDEGNTWTSLASNTYTPTVNSGQTIMFKGNLTPVYDSGIGTFTISKKCNLEGNCMSLLFGDDAVNNNSLSGKNYAFYELFSDCTTIIQVSETFLPATTLAIRCYESMFRYCTSLTTAPELPATTLGSYCYLVMFQGCTRLTAAPSILPATTLADGCYRYMFSSCTSLTTAPALPATTLASDCYSSMFQGCSSLTTAPELPATTLDSSCYISMFYNCTSLTVAPELPATTLASDCYRSMFYGCSGLTSAPELPATTLASDCYYYMFYGCKKLNYIKMLATNISASKCLYNWVSGVASTGTFVKNPAMTSLPTGTSGIPNGWTVLNANK